jgi:hypothetical protein
MGVLLLECVKRTRVGDGFARCGDVKHGRLEDHFGVFEWKEVGLCPLEVGRGLACAKLRRLLRVGGV